jgi:hypothetical protein
MNLKKIVILLLAGILALSFVLPAISQTTTEASQPVAADEIAVSGEAWVRQNQAVSPDDEATVNQNEDQAAQAAPPDAGTAASEENGQQ